MALMSQLWAQTFNLADKIADMKKVTATLVYDPTFPAPTPFTIAPQPFCNGNILPFDQQPMIGQPYPGGADVK